jgi:hypothetical protein
MNTDTTILFWISSVFIRVHLWLNGAQCRGEPLETLGIVFQEQQHDRLLTC